jgi:hypothetical protein
VNVGIAGRDARAPKIAELLQILHQLLQRLFLFLQPLLTLKDNRRLLDQLITQNEFAEFLTLQAYEMLE